MDSPPRSFSPRSIACGNSMELQSSLPTDLLLAFFPILPSDADRVRFRVVYSRWGAAAAAWRPRPWLVGSRTDRSGQGTAMSSFWLSHAAGLVPFTAIVPPGLVLSVGRSRALPVVPLRQDRAGGQRRQDVVRDAKI